MAMVRPLNYFQPCDAANLIWHNRELHPFPPSYSPVPYHPPKVGQTTFSCRQNILHCRTQPIIKRCTSLPPSMFIGELINKRDSYTYPAGRRGHGT